MATDGNAPSPERDRTNESLRAEREKTDHALSENQEAVEADADLVVQRARNNADAVLGVAREKADRQLGQATSQAGPVSTIAEEREVEDEVLERERAVADESLRRERVAKAGALARLLPIEREKTDQFLLTERVHSDDAVAVRDDFLGIVSHDLRSLLGGIVLSADLLKREGIKSAAGTLTIVETSRIHRYAMRMDRLIGDLLDIASIEAGELSITKTRGDLNLLAAEIVETFHAPASAKGITLTAEPLYGPHVVEFDHDRLLQVLGNLVSNSIKFTAAGGHVSVRVGRETNELQVSVTDNGIGIPATMLEAVFERFWQVGKNDRRGTGLGLYISKCIVEAHGGKIWATSEPGKGSVFTFTLRSVDA